MVITDQDKVNKLLSAAQRLVDYNNPDAALDLLKSNGLKDYGIVSTRSIDKDGKPITINKIASTADKTEPFLAQFITCDPEMLALKDDIRKLAHVDDEVLIIGPTGTGKEIFAHALHGTRQGKFMALNCAGLPEALVESELFGHVAGAYTDAKKDNDGLIMSARGGTLFLDEIGELPLQAQAKLLRVIQERKLRPVGSLIMKDVTCRFVFATNRNIEEMCKDKLFRGDLYARISVFELHTTGLNNRPNDIKLILESLGADSKVQQYCERNPDKFPFNVRSLQSIVKRYKTLGRLG